MSFWKYMMCGVFKPHQFGEWKHSFDSSGFYEWQKQSVYERRCILCDAEEMRVDEGQQNGSVVTGKPFRSTSGY